MSKISELNSYFGHLRKLANSRADLDSLVGPFKDLLARSAHLQRYMGENSAFPLDASVTVVRELLATQMGIKFPEHEMLYMMRGVFKGPDINSLGYRSTDYHYAAGPTHASNELSRLSQSIAVELFKRTHPKVMHTTNKIVFAP